MYHLLFMSHKWCGNQSSGIKAVVPLSNPNIPAFSNHYRHLLAVCLLKATFHFTVSVRGQHATGRIQITITGVAGCLRRVKRCRCFWYSSKGHIGMSNIVEWEAAFTMVVQLNWMQRTTAKSWQNWVGPSLTLFGQGQNGPLPGFSFVDQKTVELIFIKICDLSIIMQADFQN